MPSLSHTERQHLESVQIDPAHVGARAGVGAQSVVHWYKGGAEGAKRVVKMPLYQVWSGFYSQTMGRLLGQTYESVCRELELCQKHFGPYTVPTEILADDRRERFCVVQDAVDMRRLTPELHGERSDLQHQLADVVERNKTLMREAGVWFDAMGWNLGRFAKFQLMGKPYLDNIVVDREKDALRLFDYGLFPLPEQAKHFRWYYNLLLSTQAKNMRGYGLEFTERPER